MSCHKFYVMQCVVLKKSALICVKSLNDITSISSTIYCTQYCFSSQESLLRSFFNRSSLAWRCRSSVMTWRGVENDSRVEGRNGKSLEFENVNTPFNKHSHGSNLLKQAVTDMLTAFGSDGDVMCLCPSYYCWCSPTVWRELFQLTLAADDCCHCTWRTV